ncbi:MAG TPA: hypothetical protein VKS81_05990 [Bacteroidota bacterium]|nr:hypothetical protein [Bacteroidota bacterium]
MATKLAIIVGALLILGEFVFFNVYRSKLRSDLEIQHAPFAASLSSTADSIRLLRLQIDSLKQQVPGLGEYMTAIQLHISKMWFAAQASNWGLARYEFDEMGEAMDGAQALHSIKNKVDISSVMDGVRHSQLPTLNSAIATRNLSAFRDGYTRTIAACNSCHKSSAHGFIQITIPTHEPVVNQIWKLSTH